MRSRASDVQARRAWHGVSIQRRVALALVDEVEDFLAAIAHAGDGDERLIHARPEAGGAGLMVGVMSTLLACGSAACCGPTHSCDHYSMGETYRLWRAVDQEGNVLDALVQS